MNCKKCGTPLVENDQFCRNCGAPVNEVNAQTNYGQAPKNSTLKFVLIFVGIAVIVAAIIIAVAICSGNKVDKKDDIKVSKNEVITNIDDEDEEEKEVVVKPTTKSTYTVKFEGFTFKIPTDLVYQTETDAVLLGDEDGTWAATISVIGGSYNQLASNKSQLQSRFQQQGYTTSAAVEKTISGMPFIVLEGSMGGQNALIAYAKANSMYIFALTAFNLDNEFDYEILENISSVLSSAEFTGETSNMNAFEGVDLSVASRLAQ